ncbi:MAG: autotransporter-associated beta strand repeat-containing protein [Verrucomicrobiota bacterium]
MKIIRQSIMLAVIGIFLLTTSSYATQRIWSGTGSNSYWTNAANWGGIAPAANADALIFAGSLRLNNTNNLAAITNVSLTFSNAGFILNGNPVTQNGNIANITGTNTINTDLSLLLLPTITLTAGQLNINGLISGGFGLTTGGSGTLQLGRANGYTGVTTINTPSILVITNANALGTGNINQGGKAGTTPGGTLVLALQGNNTITNTFNGYSSTTDSDTASPCIQNISGTNTITSRLFVNNGGGNGTVFQSDGGLLILAGTIDATVSSRTVQLTGSGNGWVTGVITNAGANSYFPRKYGSGTWTLMGTNTFTGNPFEIYSGTGALGPNGSISNSTGVNMVRAGTYFDVSAKAGGWGMNSGQTLQGFGSVIGSVVTPNNASVTIQPGTGLGQSVMNISGNLSLGGGPTTINYNLSDDPTGLIHPSDKIIVAGNLTAQNTNKIVLGSYIGFLNNGTYPLISYGGTFTGDITNFTVSGFTAIGRGAQAGYITNVNKAISLVVTGTPAANLTWRGYVTGNWDTNALNWTNSVAGTSDKFYQYDAVNFDDSALNFVVNVTNPVTAGGLTVSNSSNNYAIGLSGAGVIQGNAGLTKLGSGKLTLTGANTWTGPNTYSAGIVAVPSLASPGPLGNANNSIGANQYLNGGTLEDDNTAATETSTRFFLIGTNGGTISVTNPATTLTFSSSGAFVSSGTAYPCLTKAGPGTLTFSLQQQLLGTNKITGGILLQNGLTTGSLFGSDLTSPIIINGGAFDLNGQGLGIKPVVVSGMGDLAINGNTNGAIVNSGVAQNSALQFVTMTGDTAFGGTGRWDIRGNPTATLSTSGNAHKLVKVGANQVSLNGVTVDSALGDISVRVGTLSVEGTTTGLGNPANTVTVENGATFNLFALATTLNKQIVLKDNSILGVTSGANTIAGAVNMPGDTASGPTVNLAAGTSLTLNGVVSGAGNLNLTGGGTLNLNANETYSGTTTVTAGKLVVKSANIGNGSITVNDNATLGVIVSGTSQLSGDVLTLGNSVGPVTSEFTGVASTTIAPINATNLYVNGPTTINILSGTFLTGQIYPLINFTSISGSGSLVVGTLPPLVTATVVTNGNTIALSVSSSAAIQYWTGKVNGNWDINTTTNWMFNSAAAKYANGNPVQFDDTASNATVNVTTTVLPADIFVNNDVLNYSFSGNPIGGKSLTKQGASALSLFNANGYTNGTILYAGTLNINNNGALGTGALTINGGTIDNTGGTPVTVTNAQAWNGDFAFGGNQDITLSAASVALNTNRQLTATGAGTLTVSSAISDGGAGNSLTLAGGNVTLSGENTYKGGTAVLGGNLLLRGNQSAANGGLAVGTNGVASSATIAAGAKVSVAVTNQFGTTNQIQIGNDVAFGANANLNVNGSVTNNGNLLAARAAIVTLNTNSYWLQTGDMEVRGLGGVDANFNLNTNSTFLYTGVNTIKLNGADANVGHAYLNISGQFITGVAFEQTSSPFSGFGRVGLNNGGTLKLSAAVADLAINGVQFATFNAGGTVDTAGFDAGITYPIYGSGSLTKAGAGKLTLSGTETYTGNTFVNAGTLALDASGSLASTNIVVAGGAIMDVSATSMTLTSQVLGNSTSTAILNGNIDASLGAMLLTYASSTPSFAVANGTLTLASTTTFGVNNTGGALANGSYLLIATNLGGAVVVSDTLPAVIVTGNGMGTGGSAVLNLANSQLYLNVTGASSVNTNAFTIGTVVTPTSIQLKWPPDRLGWKLQIQTNALNTGLGTNWAVWPGSTTVTNLTIPINPANPAVFIRMTYP